MTVISVTALSQIQNECHAVPQHSIAQIGDRGGQNKQARKAAYEPEEGIQGKHCAVTEYAQ